MKTVNWGQKVYIEDKLIGTIRRTNTIGERKFVPIRTLDFSKKTAVLEFVEPGTWILSRIK